MLARSELIEKARRIREHIIRMLLASGSGHAAGPLGMADIYAVLYFDVLKHNPKQPDWAERDRLVLSCGHTAPVRYAAMAEAGYFPVEELASLRQLHSRLQGHPSRLDMPGLETSSGPLGQGLSQAIGMALAAERGEVLGLPGGWHTFCITSDGEHQEGQTWEAVQFAGATKLSGLTVIIDRNRIQISGDTESVLPMNNLGNAYRSFGWHVVEIDGNSVDEVRSTLQKAREYTGGPLCVLAHTVPGKGVSFMENDYRWHGRTPTTEEAKKALEELEAHG